MDADANANANANADARGSTIALRERCSGELKITLKLPSNSQKPLFKYKKLVINTRKYDLCFFLHKKSCKMV